METKEFQTMIIKPERKFVPSKVGQNSEQSVWVEFVTLAAKCKAVNLGQGFSDAPIPEFIAKYLAEVSSCPERTDWHQYARGYGHGRLVNILAKFYSKLLNAPVEPQTNILVSVGAYLSLYYSFIGWLNPGDEFLNQLMIGNIGVFFSFIYVSQIKMAGGVPIPIVLEYDETQETASKAFRLDLEAIRSKITPKTKMLVLNNPNNPTGKLFSRDELEGIAKIVEEENLIVVADEVYEWHVYPGNEMIRFASLKGMYNRTITIGSAGKCFSVTGWKTGWSIGPEWILEPLKKVHENCVFTCPTPTQEAIAQAFESELELIESGKTEKSYLLTSMVNELLPKRDLLTKVLRRTGFSPIVPDSGYFMMTSFSHLTEKAHLKPLHENDPLDYQFVRWLCSEKKLAAIPPSAFYSVENRKGNDQFIRLCFFKKDETLESAAKILEEF